MPRRMYRVFLSQLKSSHLRAVNSLRLGPMHIAVRTIVRNGSLGIMARIALNCSTVRMIFRFCVLLEPSVHPERWGCDALDHRSRWCRPAVWGLSSPHSRLDDDRSSTNRRTQAGARTFAVHLYGATWVAVYGWSLG